MKIYTNNENGILTISLEGRLDTATSPELEALLKEKMDDADAIIFDFEKLEYISSAGLRVLLFAQKKMKNSMKLINVCELVMEVFELTGFVDILIIE